MKVGAPIRPEDLAAVHVAIVQGRTTQEIDAEKGWSSGRADEVYNALLAQEEVRQSNRRAPVVFADYALRARGHMRALDDVYERAMGKDTQNLNAAVAAVRAKQDVLDRTIARGQDLGQITKTAQEHKVLVGTMDDAALQEMVMRELRQLQDLSARHSNRTMLQIEPERPQIEHRAADRARVYDAELAPAAEPTVPQPPAPLPPSRAGARPDRASVARPAADLAGSGPSRPPVVRRKAVAPATR